MAERLPLAASIAGVCEHPKRTTTSTKLSILQSVCGDQAVQESRAGNHWDAIEWMGLREQVGRLG